MEWLFSRVNSFNFVKNGILQVLNMIILGFNLTVMFFIQDIPIPIMHILNIITIVVATTIIVVGYMALNRYAKKIKSVEGIILKTASGELRHREINIDETEEIGKVAWALNDLLDQIETFTRDLNSSLEMISQGKSHRRMYPTGLKGDFVVYSNNINKALEKIATAQSKDAFIQDILKIIDEYKNNDYRNTIDTTGMQQDIIGLAEGINQLGKNLADLSLENLHNGLSIQKGAQELLDNVYNINQASQEQSRSLEETSSTLDEIISNIHATNEHTIKMTQYASEVTKSAEDGKELANETAKSMEMLNSEVTSINDAIAVIDQIAFQTNILSLNAAVEAATAGEAGKGFAVVAQEVRNLASRSAEAAKEIKDLVQSATEKANSGKLIADNMIDGYLKLNDSIDSTTKLINQVATATKEQEQGIININNAINILDQKTQETAKIVQETNIIAIQSNDIAQIIVEDAKSK